MGNEFTHLHVHTEYSILDGAAKISRLPAYVNKLGQNAVAITDHGALHGVHDFYSTAKKAGVKPIIGMEGYMARGSHLSKTAEDRKPYHMLMLAMDNGGYGNISKLSSIAYMDGFYYKPRFDAELLERYNAGIVVTSGCLAAPIPQAIMRNDEASAHEWLDWFSSVFDDGRFYLEVQPRDHSVEQNKVNKWLLAESIKRGLPVIATTDAHYIEQGDAKVHDELLCIQTSAKLSDDNRMRFDEDTYYIASADEMASHFSGRLDVLSNTMSLAEKLNVEFKYGTYSLPEYPIPDGYTHETYLRHLVQLGLRWRYSENASSSEVQERMEYELAVINKMRYPAYFLVVWDICMYARKNNIWFNARGSAAGSIVAYSLGITSIEPLENGLYFDRFLNSERASMPDIDLDFEDQMRESMLQYLVNRYGSERIASIITFGLIGDKQSLKDSARIRGVDLTAVNMLSKALDSALDKHTNLADVLADDTMLTYKKDDKTPAIMKPISQWLDETEGLRDAYVNAIPLEGYVRSAGTHAAGIIIASSPVSDISPLYRATKKTNETCVTQSTQFDMHLVESLGMLKVDFLGLKTLTAMRIACEAIEVRHGIRFNVDTIPYLPDVKDKGMKKVYQMITSGNTAGVFQLESDGMTKTIREMKPTRYANIVAAVALFRPGPIQFIESYNKRLHGEEPVTYRHPKLESVLSETLGLCIYQESVMAISRIMFDYTGSEADYLRKDMAKKTGKMGEHKVKFDVRGKANGHSQELIDAIWGDLLTFAEYGFPKAHAADYAKLTLQSAYLKAHYPHEYLVGLLTAYVDTPDRTEVFLRECSKFNIKLSPPDMRYPSASFSLIGDTIHYGMANVKKVGDAMIANIIKSYNPETDNYRTLQDLMLSVDLSAVNSSALDCLIKTGAFDVYGKRGELLAALPSIRDWCNSHHRGNGKAVKNESEAFMNNMFSSDDFGVSAPKKIEVPSLKMLMPRDGEVHVSEEDIMAWETELLGIPVTIKQSAYLTDMYEQYNTTSVASLMGMTFTGKMSVKIGGKITDLKTKNDKNGKAMAMFKIKDWRDGTEIKCVAFSTTYNKIKAALEDGKHVFTTGKADASYGTISLSVDTLKQI